MPFLIPNIAYQIKKRITPITEPKIRTPSSVPKVAARLLELLSVLRRLSLTVGL